MHLAGAIWPFLKADHTGLCFVFDSTSFTSGESHINPVFTQVNSLLRNFLEIAHYSPRFVRSFSAVTRTLIISYLLIRCLFRFPCGYVILHELESPSSSRIV